MSNVFDGKIKEFQAQEKNRNINNVLDDIIDLGYTDDFIILNQMVIEQIIIELKPKSLRTVVFDCHVMSNYALWLQRQGIIDDSAYNKIQNIDKSKLFEKCKTYETEKRFISYQDYLQLTDDINNNELEYNKVFFRALLGCLYEGVYNSDLSVLINLRQRDIDSDKNMVTLRSDKGEEYLLTIPEYLKEDLMLLSSINFWERNTKYGTTYKCVTDGKNVDSIFKFIKSKNFVEENNKSYKWNIYSRVRNITKKYLDNKLLPNDIFISGIMHRLYVKSVENNISFEDMIMNTNRTNGAKDLIFSEFDRVHYDMKIHTFRQTVYGYLDLFTK